VGPDPEPGRINDGAARLQRTSPVGVFPQSDTPDGLVDMAGNVWEWAISEYIEEPNRHDAKALVTPVLVGPARRVLRGGSWNHATEYCRASYRDGYSPGGRDDGLGLRLVLGPIQSLEP
jgi:formylglycine-generating enzyme required for sulfatase activity